ncbi:MAG: MMPL family transporter [Candidatus Cryptobacteroides sp.]
MKLRVYDFFREHRAVMWTSLGLLTLLCLLLVSNLRYSEDITDFVPLGTKDREALNVYQKISGADRLVILFSGSDDPDRMVDGIEHFVEKVRELDTENWCGSLAAQFDMSAIQEVADFVMDNIPYFLTPEDHTRIDSLLAQPGYVEEKILQDRQALSFPAGPFVVPTIVKDPLGLFSPVLSRLNTSNENNIFEIYDGYVFTPDMSRAIVLLNSPFGSSETSNNSRLLALLKEAVESVGTEFPDLRADIVGGPEIAVGNASRIKTDSIIAVIVAGVLIILLLATSFGSFKNILLILLSIGWGWLFAVGGISLLVDKVSIIVIGISSVILGIAVNYPLHLIAHSAHQKNMKEAVREIFMPLLVGNITTVGAFLALVPLQATALRHLGIFASLLLLGTILFVLLYLPHFVRTGENTERKSRFLDAVAGFSPENHRSLLWVSLALTAVFAFFSFRTEFDSNISNINYMTSRQREDMAYFQNLFSNSKSAQSVYVLSSGSAFDDALSVHSGNCAITDSLCGAGLVQGCKSVAPFLVSREEQQKRLDNWSGFCARYASVLPDRIDAAARQAGFAPGAFSGFCNLLSAPVPAAQPLEYFSPLISSVFVQKLTEIDGVCYVVDVLSVEPENMDAVKACYGNCFDVVGMNSALSNNLSDNFNYIGWACSLIVFFFLWFSFGRLELAIIAFLPMAVSWIWILGIMGLFGIKFNIVNIILATFIFGQGDDYTIFMTEGCQHEYTWRRPILKSYKKSILQSALIMFVGIGSLIVARHPAMHSLAQVTIVGMFSVVLMSWLIPPFLFRWLTTSGGKVRPYPLTLSLLWKGAPKTPYDRVCARYTYKGMEISRNVRRNLRRREADLRQIPASATIEITDEGYGESAIYLALIHPEAHILAHISDPDRLTVARVSAEDFVSNVSFNSCPDCSDEGCSVTGEN